MVMDVFRMRLDCATTSLLLFRRFDGDGHPRCMLRQRADKPFMFRFRLRRKAFQLLERGPS